MSIQRLSVDAFGLREDVKGDLVRHDHHVAEMKRAKGSFVRSDS
jgi:hypothetical protein